MRTVVNRSRQPAKPWSSLLIVPSFYSITRKMLWFAAKSLRDWGYAPARSCIAQTSIRDSTPWTAGVIDNELQNLHPKGVRQTRSSWCFQSSLHPLSRPNHLGWSPLDSRSPCLCPSRCEPHAAPITKNDCNPGWIKRVQPASQTIFGCRNSVQHWHEHY